MPSCKKMLRNTRKKVTASAVLGFQLGTLGKILHSLMPHTYGKKTGTVSTLNTADQVHASSAPSQNDAIMSMLHEIKESNASLARRLDRFEQTSTKDVTSLISWSHTHKFPSYSSLMESPQLLASNTE